MCKAFGVLKTREALTVLSARAAVFIMKFTKEPGFAEDSVLDSTARPLSQRRELGAEVRTAVICGVVGGSARNGLESVEVGGRGAGNGEF